MNKTKRKKFYEKLCDFIWFSREKQLNGLIDFKTAMRAGVLTAVFYSILLGLFTFINYSFINTDYLILQKPNASMPEIESSKSFLEAIIRF